MANILRMMLKAPSISVLLAISVFVGASTVALGQVHYRHRHQINHRRLRPTHGNIGAPSSAGSITVDITSGHALNKFSPSFALGASTDAIGVDGIPTIYTQSNIANMLSGGMGSQSYRLYTELNVQDWHWNPVGTWSDAANSQGYFIGSSNPSGTITDSYGFLLPHRGMTVDPGDNQDFSRLTDGNATTYWKSNPYLSSVYTKESDTLHPQWVIVDLGSVKSIDTVKIQWANPYAVTYSIQYWTGTDAMYDPMDGQWTTFSNGSVTNGTGGTTTSKVSSSPVSAQYVRILMNQSSNTYDTHGTSDPRNKMGYAIYEIWIGKAGSGSSFTDYVNHTASQSQTATYVSSTDPWHTNTRQNPATEQIGLDYFYASPITQNLPALLPIAMVYSTPENAVAEVAYAAQKGFPVIGYELGEEPDGQFMTPEDYGAFYIQWANAIHAAYPNAKLGGPVLSNSSIQTWPDATGNTDWIQRFIAYLSSHGALSQLAFVSTEHYPFWVPSADWTLLPQEPGQVQTLFNEFWNASLPKTVPVYVTEYNMDAGASESTVDIEAALWHSLFVGEFLKQGGAASFYYQEYPVQLATDGTVWGSLGMFTADANDQVTGYTSQYFSNVLMNQIWCQPGSNSHSLLPTTSTVKDSSGNTAVYAYGLSRPDGLYSVLIINIDSVEHSLSVQFTDSSNHGFTGLTSRYVLSSANYAWNVSGANGYASPDGPIQAIVTQGAAGQTYKVPAHSIMVIRGRIK